MLQIIQVPPNAVEMAQGVKIDIPALAYVGIDDGEIIGSGGLAWGGGRCWVWLHLPARKPRYAIALMHQAKAMLGKARQLGETAVFTPRDAEYPTSDKLLTVLGFRFFAMENNTEVWRYEWL